MVKNTELIWSDKVGTGLPKRANPGRHCRQMLTRRYHSGFGILEVRSLCGVDSTGFSASLRTLPVGRSIEHWKKRNEPSRDGKTRRCYWGTQARGHYRQNNIITAVQEPNSCTITITMTPPPSHIRLVPCEIQDSASKIKNHLPTFCLQSGPTFKNCTKTGFQD